VSSVLSREWVDAVVQEMMAARDLDDARQRAAGALQSFGTTVAQCAVQAKVSRPSCMLFSLAHCTLLVWRACSCPSSQGGMQQCS